MQNFTHPQRFKASVIEKTQLTPHVYKARYQLINPPELAFFAGQTMMIKVADGENRAMSIASPPQETKVLTSYQDTSPGGPGSKWMELLKVGDNLELMAPLGRFTIDRESMHKRVLVATGTGIAPFRSMLLDASDNLTEQKEVSLYWGLRHTEDIYIQDELEELVRNHPNLKYYLVLSKPAPDWIGLSGHTTEYVLENEKDPSGCDFYLCGNQNMIKELTEKLVGVGVLKAQIKFDPFY